MIVGCVCTDCGSDRMGYVCRCGDMRCSCDREACPNCENQRHYEEERERQESEQADRENFEDEMERKYRN